MKSTKGLKVGDKLYRYDLNGIRTIIKIDAINNSTQIDEGGYCRHIRSFHGRIKPKTPRLECWINLYPKGLNGAWHASKDRADAYAIPGRISCVHMREVRKKAK